ncbi:MAG: hypothetical protein Q7J60_24625 [Bradyrhizobium sp.]|nr:hypothetical protein [Bradyrhizobium sp.]
MRSQRSDVRGIVHEYADTLQVSTQEPIGRRMDTIRSMRSIAASSEKIRNDVRLARLVWWDNHQRRENMKIATLALASALALTGTFALAQSGAMKQPSSQGAPTGAAVDSMGTSTSPGAVKSGTSAGGAASMNNNGNVGVTTGANSGAMMRPGTGASEQGAPTGADVNSRGDATEPGAVKQGTSTTR